MALTKDQYVQQQADYYSNLLNAQKQAKLQALKQARDNALAAIAAQRQDLTTQRDQTMPTFQTQRNSADATFNQNVQNLRNLMAARGLYRSGSAVSEEANLASARQNALSKIDTDQNNFLQNWQNKYNALGDQERLANKQFGDSSAALDTEIADQLNAYRIKAAQDWEEQQRQLAAAMAKARSGGGSGGGGGRSRYLSGSTNPNTAAKMAVDQAVDSGATYNQIYNEINAQAQDLIDAGVNINNLLSYLYSKTRVQKTPNPYAGYQYSAKNGYYSATPDYVAGAYGGGRGMGGRVPI